MLKEVSQRRLEKNKIRFTHLPINYGVANNQRQHVILLIENIETGVVMPHPLTEFLMQYRDLELSSITQKVYVIEQFLNFLISNLDIYNLKKLSDITLQHGEDFLNEIADGKLGSEKAIQKDTVKASENVLKYFYKFLIEKEILSSVSYNDISRYIYTGDNGQERMRSPFSVRYPSKRRTSKLTTLPLSLILPFIDLARIETPDIAFGIYLEIFGGLRISEIINISRNGIELIGRQALNGINVDLIERNYNNRLKNKNGKGGVKRSRNQYILPIMDYLCELYENHLELIKDKNNTDAMFINRDGNPMSEKNYRDRFDKLKKIFIQRLTDLDEPYFKSYAITLNSKKWSSHICRGVFSQLISDYCKNPTEVAVLRGDKSYESVFRYLQGSFQVQSSINEALQQSYENLRIGV